MKKENEEDDLNFYEQENLDEDVEDDKISAVEEGFMLGYMMN